MVEILYRVKEHGRIVGYWAREIVHGSEIHLDMDNLHLKYLGPKSLEKFICINDFDGQVISVETQFTYGTEEEY